MQNVISTVGPGCTIASGHLRDFIKDLEVQNEQKQNSKSAVKKRVSSNFQSARI